MPPSESTATSVVPPPTSTTIDPVGSVTAWPHPGLHSGGPPVARRRHCRFRSHRGDKCWAAIRRSGDRSRRGEPRLREGAGHRPQRAVGGGDTQRQGQKAGTRRRRGGKAGAFQACRANPKLPRISYTSCRWRAQLARPTVLRLGACSDVRRAPPPEREGDSLRIAVFIASRLSQRVLSSRRSTAYHRLTTLVVREDGSAED